MKDFLAICQVIEILFGRYFNFSRNFESMNFESRTRQSLQKIERGSQVMVGALSNGKVPPGSIKKFLNMVETWA